jgi:hypothetical protein
MKWYKHFTDNHRGKSTQYLLDELSYFGPFFKETIFEMCAEKLDRKDDRELSADDCVFVFHRRTVESATRAKRSTVGRALVAGQSANFWTFTENGEYFEIKIPILLDLFEYDQKKSRQRRAEVTPGTRLDQNRIEKNRIDQNIVVSTEPTKSVAVVAKKSIFLFKFGDKEIAISEELVQSWSETYPKEFLEIEIKKARNWLLSNPHKAPKSNFARFFNSWFNNGWETFRRGLKSNPVKVTENEMAAILEGL